MRTNILFLVGSEVLVFCARPRVKKLPTTSSYLAHLRRSSTFCSVPFSINEEGGVRSSLASEARLSFIIHPTRFWLTIAFYSNYSLVFLVTVARPDERENYFPFPDRPRAEVGTILYFLVGSFFIIYSKFFSSIRFISFRKNRSCGNARF